MKDWLNMIFCQQHLREVADSQSVNETLIGCGKHLNTILTSTETLNTSIELTLHQGLAEILVNVEQHNLTVTTSNAYLVIGNCLDSFNTLSANRLTEDEHLVFDLERAEVTRLSSGKQELLVWLRESHAGIVSDHSSCLHGFVFALAKCWIKRPQSKFLGSRNSELVARCISKLDIFNESTPTYAGNTIGKNLRSNLERGYDLSILSVPNKEFSVELITGRNE